MALLISIAVKISFGHLIPAGNREFPFRFAVGRLQRKIPQLGEMQFSATSGKLKAEN